MSKVTVTQNMEPGWSNRRSGRGEPQSPAAARTDAPPPVVDEKPDPPAAPDAPTEATKGPKAGKGIRAKKPTAKSKKRH